MLQGIKFYPFTLQLAQGSNSTSKNCQQRNVHKTQGNINHDIIIIKTKKKKKKKKLGGHCPVKQSKLTEEEESHADFSCSLKSPHL